MSSQSSLRLSLKRRTKIKMKFRGVGCRRHNPFQLEIAKPIVIAVHDHIIVGKHKLGVLSLKIVGQSGMVLANNESASRPAVKLRVTQRQGSESHASSTGIRVNHRPHVIARFGADRKIPN